MSGSRNNGLSHQDPGFIDHVVKEKAEMVRVYLPPDANTLLSVADHCLRSRNNVNVIVAGKAPATQWLDIEAAGHVSQYPRDRLRHQWACHCGDMPEIENWRGEQR